MQSTGNDQLHPLLSEVNYDVLVLFIKLKQWSSIDLGNFKGRGTGFFYMWPQTKCKVTFRHLFLLQFSMLFHMVACILSSMVALINTYFKDS